MRILKSRLDGDTTTRKGAADCRTHVKWSTASMPSTVSEPRCQNSRPGVDRPSHRGTTIGIRVHEIKIFDKRATHALCNGTRAPFVDKLSCNLLPNQRSKFVRARSKLMGKDLLCEHVAPNRSIGIVVAIRERSEK